jgi:mevalonate kinase
MLKDTLTKLSEKLERKMVGGENPLPGPDNIKTFIITKESENQKQIYDKFSGKNKTLYDTVYKVDDGSLLEFEGYASITDILIPNNGTCYKFENINKNNHYHINFNPNTSLLAKEYNRYKKTNKTKVCFYVKS